MENIKTNRLILRKPQKSDAVSLLPLLGDNKVKEFTPGLSFKTINDIRKFIHYSVELCDYENDFCILIENLKTQDVIGIINSYLFLSSDGVMTISYAIKECIRGQGVMTEALKAFLLYLHNNANTKEVEFCIREDNYPSLKVMKKLNIPPYNQKGNYIYYRLSLKEKPSF